MKNSDFDLDLKAGQLGESAVASLLGIDTVEVKRDFKWFETGNLFIEFECYSITERGYVPSGIAITKSTHWAFDLGDTVIVTPTEYIKDMIEEMKANSSILDVSNNTPPNPSRGYLIRTDDILKYQNKKGPEITNV